MGFWGFVITPSEWELTYQSINTHHYLNISADSAVFVSQKLSMDEAKNMLNQAARRSNPQIMPEKGGAAASGGFVRRLKRGEQE